MKKLITIPDQVIKDIISANPEKNRKEIAYYIIDEYELKCKVSSMLRHINNLMNNRKKVGKKLQERIDIHKFYYNLGKIINSPDLKSYARMEIKRLLN